MKRLFFAVVLMAGAAFGESNQWHALAVNTNTGAMSTNVAALKLTNGAAIFGGKIDTTNIIVYTIQGTNYYTPLQLLTP